MGVYDEIRFKCPECGVEHCVQSKSGPCALDAFDHTSVPIDVAMDANRHAPFECSCGKKWQFTGTPLKVERICIDIEPADPDSYA